MGFGDLVLFYVVTTFSLRWIATAAAAGPSAILIWVIACIAFFIPLAFCVLELSSRYPEEGGLYVWTKRAFGEGAGFLTGWMYWGANVPYFPGLLYFAAGNALFIGGARWQSLSTNSTYFIVAALAGLTLSYVLNLVGLDVGKWLHNIGAIASWTPPLVLIAMGLVAWRLYGSATEFSLATIRPSTGLKDVIFWSTIAFAFGGVESASFMGEEIQDARRNIPRALVAAGISMTAIYIVATTCILIALPQSEVTGLQGFMQAISKVAERVGIGSIVPLMALIVTLSSIGGVGAWFAASSRIPFVVGLDRFLPAAYARLHPRWGTPHVALTTQAVIAGIFIFLGQAGTTVRGAYEVLVSMGIITYFIPYLFMFAAMIKLQNEPAGPQVMRVPGGKATAILFSCLGLASTTIAIIIAAIPPDAEPNKPLAMAKIVGLNVLMIAIGGVFYLAKKRPGNV